ncbi:MAG: pyridoxal 5'-phosphate synthase glutaminase subunit PdxT [Chloroflexi bacterium]|nr:pyridoxal 5'-phosphate synthase glutaminase subunit PdxT [Chloroflexota bacterium]
MLQIGVLALQGAFYEHIKKLQQLGVQTVAVRLPEQLTGLDGLIIPGGESTTMGNLAMSFGLVQPLRQFSRQHPVWGTCAGLILLADAARGQKKGGQALIGGLDVEVDRNYFGRQVDSFETELHVPALAKVSGPDAANGLFHAIFIRAPVVTRVGPKVEVLARLSGGEIVAVQQGRLLGTAFHPELSDDLRFHRYFVALSAGALAVSGNGHRHRTAIHS